MREWQLRSIEKAYIHNYEGDLLGIVVAGEKIESTPFHPFWVVRGNGIDARPQSRHGGPTPEGAREGRWVDAGDLCVADELMLRDGRAVPIEAIERRAFSGNVYNISVADLACYAVGRNNVLVHNKSADFVPLRRGSPEPPVSGEPPAPTALPPKAASTEAAELRPYGGPGGGHHVPAKSAFSGAPGYDMNQALAIPNAELATLGVNHRLVSGAQMTGYKAFAQTGATLTWEAAEQIETQALIRGGMQPGTAQATVQQAIQALKDSGVSGPTRIPWGGQ